MPTELSATISAISGVRASLKIPPPPGSRLVNRELELLAPDTLLELYELDASPLGGGRMFFYAGTNRLYSPIQFNGDVYTALPCEVRGFEHRSKGELPRPSATFANVSGLFTGLALAFEDLIGAKFVRRRIFLQNLVATATPEAALVKFPDDVFYVERKVIENKNLVEFELGTPLDIEGVMLPRRQTVANTCYWRYRSPECGYAQSKVVADSTDTLLGVTGQRYTGAWSVGTLYSRSDVVYILSNGIRRHFILTVAQAQGETFQPPNPSFWKEDRCSKRVAGCKLRFDPQGLNSPLPFGGFPGTARIPLS